MPDDTPLMAPHEAYRLGAEHQAAYHDSGQRMTAADIKVLLASSVGTMFEWYDFFLYGSLAAIIGANFFAGFDETSRTWFALLAFAVGFLIRPAGAFLFGGLGDRIGRKYTFFITILLMGLSTVAVGMLPGSGTIGMAAPVILITLRLVQGLAMGGEYGGAAIYVAEHAPPGRRGFFTSFIQVTGTAGLLLSLLVILAVRSATGEDAFAAWGWRIPFLLSSLLLLVSIWIRLQLDESPAWLRMKEAGTASRTPIKDAFGTWPGLRMGLIALFGLAMGQTVVWYTGQYYALFFLGSILKVDGYTANLLVAWALLVGCPFFLVFGWLSDKIGRKPVILGGCLLAALTYFPMFHMLSSMANPALYAAQERVNAVLNVDPATCHFQFNPVGTAKFTTPCDVAKAALTRAAVPYTVHAIQPGDVPLLKLGDTPIILGTPDFGPWLAKTLADAGYPAVNNPSVVRMAHPFDFMNPRTGAVILLLVLLVINVTIVYGPVAAAMIELFPTRIRYTGMSVPYHLGTGWFGGLLPTTAYAMTAATGNPYFGLWYPLAMALGTVIIGALFLPETYRRDIFEGDDTTPSQEA
jgi:MFS family permease